MTRTEEKFITIATEQLEICEDEAYDFQSLFVTLGPYAHERILAGTCASHSLQTSQNSVKSSPNSVNSSL